MIERETKSITDLFGEFCEGNDFLGQFDIDPKDAVKIDSSNVLKLYLHINDELKSLRKEQLFFEFYRDYKIMNF